jgi:hypothetical protein
MKVGTENSLAWTGIKRQLEHLQACPNASSDSAFYARAYGWNDDFFIKIAIGKKGNLYTVNNYNQLAQYNPSGKLLWKTDLGARVTEVKEITIGKNDDIYLAGVTDSTYAAWVAKYSSTGKLLWEKYLKPTRRNRPEIPSGIATDSKDNVYFVGIAYSPQSDYYIASYSWVVKYNSQGGQQWRQSSLSDNYGVFGNSIAIDSRDNFYLSGVIDFDFFSGTGDAWVAKYSSAGKQLWERRLGNTAADPDYYDQSFSYGVTIDRGGNVFVTGDTQEKLGARKYGDERDSDAWVAKYSSSGLLQWTRQLGTSDADSSAKVAVDSSNNIYLTGYTNGKLGDKQYGGPDIWLAKYSP